MKNYFFFLVISVFSLSCETSHTFTQTIDNLSQDTIRLSFSGKSLLYYPANVILHPNTEQVIYEFNTVGGEPDGMGCTILRGEIQVAISGDQQLTKDIKNEENWEQTISGNRSIIETCIFEIRDEDIEK